MAKTKQQKQAEAVARFRAQFQEKLKDRHSWKPGGHNYNTTAKTHGKAAADDEHSASERRFQIYLLNAQLDEHGQELSAADLKYLKGFFFPKQDVVDVNEPVYGESHFRPDDMLNRNPALDRPVPIHIYEAHHMTRGNLL